MQNDEIRVVAIDLLNKASMLGAIGQKFIELAGQLVQVSIRVLSGENIDADTFEKEVTEILRAVRIITTEKEKGEQSHANPTNTTQR